MLPGLLNLTYVRNAGVAFGLFASRGRPAAACCSPPWASRRPGRRSLYFWFAPSRDRLLLVALALVVGGAVGNLSTA